MHLMSDANSTYSGPSLIEYELPRRPGQINAEGVAGLLHGADENPWEVMLREAVQNSWDARTDSFIDITIEGRRATDEWSLCLVQLLPGPQGQQLCRSLGGRPFLLEISDRRTTGLDGAIGYGPNDSSSNFRRFVFETGRNKSQAGGGGSYGYGKSAFFNLSAVGTIAVYTRVRIEDDTFETRFIVIRVDREQDPGRIWWGDRLSDNPITWVEPLVGPRADDVASSLGMTRFQARETGTAILVLAPRPRTDHTEISDSETEEQAFKGLAASIVHWFWPKFCTDNREIRFLLRLEGDLIPIPEPSSTAPYSSYVKAYLCSRGSIIADTKRITIKSQRPKVTLGVLAWHESPVHGFFGIAHMREVGFVVFYRKSAATEADPVPRLGIFRTTDKSDNTSDPEEETRLRVLEAFRNSENQSHDEWNPHNCFSSWQQSVVRQALRLSWQALYSEDSLGAGTRNSTTGILRLRNEIGKRILGTRSIHNGSNNGPKTETASSASVVQFRKVPNAPPRFINDGNGNRIGIAFDFSPRANTASRRFQVKPAVRWEDGSVSTQDLDGVVTIVGITGFIAGAECPVDDFSIVASGALIVTLSKPGRYYVYVKTSRPILLDLVVQNIGEGLQP